MHPPRTNENEPYLPFDLEIHDAKVLYEKNHGPLYIVAEENNGKLWLATRSFVDGWTYHFAVTLEQAENIVENGWAEWHLVRSDYIGT